MVRALLIINGVVWFLGVLILQNYVLKNNAVFLEFGLSPLSFIYDIKVWQPFTYMFLHGEGIMHILFNSLILWFIGSELEKIWGSREFLKFYLVCGVGAGLVYALVTLIAVQAMGLNPALLSVPTVGASGAIFGLMLAYGIIFGERIIYFMMLFPMKAKHFVMILALIEVMSLLSAGLGSRVNNLAHIGGFIVGFIYLKWSSYRRRMLQDRFFKRPGRKLKLVVDNDEENNKKDRDEPTYH
jgi:membrane associated rhomboid family serine protease